jgi:hypothetical protein
VWLFGFGYYALVDDPAFSQLVGVLHVSRDAAILEKRLGKETHRYAAFFLANSAVDWRLASNLQQSVRGNITPVGSSAANRAS